MLDHDRAKAQLQRIRSEIQAADLEAPDTPFPSLRSVDAKVREVKLVLEAVGAASLVAEIAKDADFEANSRRVRLEALANYCATALNFLAGGVVRATKQLVRGPDLSKITSIFPGLEPIIQDRWLEAQRCQYAKAHLAAVILMGSILEGLLLARASRDLPAAFRSRSAPRTKEGKNVPVQDWSLNALIEVAVDLGWIKTDRGGFSHAMRESRNVVHPWVHVTTGANFDDATCSTCWHVLNAAVQDLLAST